MNIQITNIPNGQKIKSIDFKIEFDDSSFVTNSVITPAEPTISVPDTLQHTPVVPDTSNVSNMPDIDISNRPAKIPEEMLEESF